MNKLKLKGQIIQKALDAYTGRMQNKRDNQLDMLETTKKFKNDNFEMSDEANREETLERVEERAVLLDQMNDNLQNLARATPVLQSKVGIGAVVLTNMQNFFVGASIPNFEVEGRAYVGISPDTPIYEELRDKKAGEEVRFQDRTYQIQEVF